ncbi:unnamed protein product, partial [Musa banksii]
GGVAGEHLYQRQPQRRREPVRHHLKEVLVGVAEVLRELRRPLVRDELPAPRRSVGRVPGVGELAEVEGRMERRSDPDERGQGLGQVGDGVERKPAAVFVVALVAVADGADLVPP